MQPVRLHLPAGMPAPATPRTDPVAGVHRSLGAALSSYVMPGEEAEAARALLACLDGGCLDLRGLEEAYAHLPFVMEVPAWKALREGIAALSLGPVTTVHAGAAASDFEFNHMAIGLGVLSRLQEVHLVVPGEGDDLRLTGLRQDPPPQVFLDCPRASGLRVTVREGLVLETSGEALVGHVYLDRPERITVDAQGRELAREPLHGVLFFPPLPPGAIVAGGDPGEAREALVETDLNLRRAFPDTADTRELGLQGTPQACRHFALAYAHAQEAYEREQAHLPAARREPFPFLPGPDGKGLSMADPPAWTERAYRDMLATQAVALSSNEGFGHTMASLCDELEPAQARVYLVRAFNHMMTLKLVRPPGPTPLFLVSFYDPTRTLTEQGLWVRASDELARFALSDFLADWDLEAMNWDPEIAVVYACPSGHGSGEPRPLALHGPYLLDEPQADWLSFLVPANAIVPVMQAVAAVGEPGGEADLQVLRADVDSDCPAVHVACRRGAADGLAAYVTALLALPIGRIDAAARVELLRGIVEGDEVHPALYHAFERSPQAVAAFVRGVLGAPEAVLDGAQKRTLVAGSDDTSAARIVAEAIEGSGSLAPVDRERVDESVLAWTHEVLASTRVDESDRLELVTAAGEAAARALAVPARDGKHEQPAAPRHPGPAAALLCAVLESRLPHAERARLIEATGLSPAQVLEALAARREGRDAGWIARLLDALPGGGLPSAEVRAMRRQHAPARKGLPSLYQRPAVRALLEAGPGLSVRGLPVTPARWTEAGLEALAPDANPDMMLCAARQPPEELAPFRVTAGVRRGVVVSGDQARYLLPVDRLQAPATSTTSARESKASS